MPKLVTLILLTLSVCTFGQTTFQFDMHAFPSKQRDIYVDNYRLHKAQAYVLTVAGTFSIWESGKWDKSCGEIELRPITPSRKSNNGAVGFDPQYAFAQPIVNCGSTLPPYRESYFEVSLDGGKQWQVLTSRNTYNKEHIYVFDIIGKEEPIQVRRRLNDNSGSYGVLTFTIIPNAISKKSTKTSFTPDVISEELVIKDDFSDGEAADAPAIEMEPIDIRKTEKVVKLDDDSSREPEEEVAETPIPSPNAEMMGDSLIMPLPYRSTALSFVEGIQVKNRFVFIEIWDNSEEDGDTISLFVNGTRVLAETKLTKEKRVLKVELAEPQNTVAMYAHNLGSIGKNTASIKITDKEKVYHRQLESDMGISAAIEIRRDH